MHDNVFKEELTWAADKRPRVSINYSVIYNSCTTKELKHYCMHYYVVLSN